MHSIQDLSSQRGAGDGCFSGLPGESPSPPGGTYYAGDGFASNTYFTGVESPGLGACGGCGWGMEQGPTGPRYDIPACPLDYPNPYHDAESTATPYRCCAGAVDSDGKCSASGSTACVDTSLGPDKHNTCGDRYACSQKPCTKPVTFNSLYEHIQNKVGTNWTMAATSQAMMGGYCSGSFGMGCVGNGLTDNASSCVGPTKEPFVDCPTANAPCGSCWQLTKTDSKNTPAAAFTPVKVYVADACPCGHKGGGDTPACPGFPGKSSDNSPHCRALLGDRNSKNRYNHFDIWNGNHFKFEDEGYVGFKSIECPEVLTGIMKQACCDQYWDGQGCPNMCGSTVNKWANEQCCGPQCHLNAGREPTEPTKPVDPSCHTQPCPTCETACTTCDGDDCKFPAKFNGKSSA